jgi:hypothetical protein|nr:MAG TPA: hypothetical protein [Bacteriophage sp.]
MVLSKLAEKCKACQKVDSCDHKKMEMCALAEFPQRAMAEVTTVASVSAMAPVLRERIDSPLSSFAYKDELEKALNDAHFGNRLMMYGA